MNGTRIIDIGRVTNAQSKHQYGHLALAIILNPHEGVQP